MIFTTDSKTIKYTRVYLLALSLWLLLLNCRTSSIVTTLPPDIVSANIRSFMILSESKFGDSTEWIILRDSGEASIAFENQVMNCRWDDAIPRMTKISFVIICPGIGETEVLHSIPIERSSYKGQYVEYAQLLSTLQFRGKTYVYLADDKRSGLSELKAIRESREANRIAAVVSTLLDTPGQNNDYVMDGNLLRSGAYADFILAHLNINEHPDFFNAVRFLGDEFALKTAQNQWANIRKQPLYIRALSISNPDFLTYDFDQKGFKLADLYISAGHGNLISSYDFFLSVSTAIPVPEDLAPDFKRSIGSTRPVTLYLKMTFEEYIQRNYRVCTRDLQEGNSRAQCIEYDLRPFSYPKYRIEKFVIVRDFQVLFHS